MYNLPFQFPFIDAMQLMRNNKIIRLIHVGAPNLSPFVLF